jgi:hypothetical protein
MSSSSRPSRQRCNSGGQRGAEGEAAQKLADIVRRFETRDVAQQWFLGLVKDSGRSSINSHEDFCTAWRDVQHRDDVRIRRKYEVPANQQVAAAEAARYAELDAATNRNK